MERPPSPDPNFLDDWDSADKAGDSRDAEVSQRLRETASNVLRGTPRAGWTEDGGPGTASKPPPPRTPRGAEGASAGDRIRMQLHRMRQVQKGLADDQLQMQQKMAEEREIAVRKVEMRRAADLRKMQRKLKVAERAATRDSPRAATTGGTDGNNAAKLIIAALKSVPPPPGGKPASVHEIFRRLDTNGNGWLSRAEFHRGLRELVPSLGPDALNEFLDSMDADDDDRITFSEFYGKLGNRKPLVRGSSSRRSLSRHAARPLPARAPPSSATASKPQQQQHAGFDMLDDLLESTTEEASVATTTAAAAAASAAHRRRRHRGKGRERIRKGGGEGSATEEEACSSDDERTLNRGSHGRTSPPAKVPHRARNDGRLDTAPDASPPAQPTDPYAGERREYRPRRERDQQQRRQRRQQQSSGRQRHDEAKADAFASARVPALDFRDLRLSHDVAVDGPVDVEAKRLNHTRVNATEEGKQFEAVSDISSEDLDVESVLEVPSVDVPVSAVPKGPGVSTLGRLPPISGQQRVRSHGWSAEQAEEKREDGKRVVADINRNEGVDATSETWGAQESENGAPEEDCDENGWVSYWDETHEASYYVNLRSGECTWELPPEYTSLLGTPGTESTSVQTGTSTVHHDGEERREASIEGGFDAWIVAYDAQGRQYYYCETTGLSQWSAPWIDNSSEVAVPQPTSPSFPPASVDPQQLPVAFLTERSTRNENPASTNGSHLSAPPPPPQPPPPLSSFDAWDERIKFHDEPDMAPPLASRRAPQGGGDVNSGSSPRHASDRSWQPRQISGFVHQGFIAPQAGDDEIKGYRGGAHQYNAPTRSNALFGAMQHTLANDGGSGVQTASMAPPQWETRRNMPISMTSPNEGIWGVDSLPAAAASVQQQQSHLVALERQQRELTAAILAAQHGVASAAAGAGPTPRELQLQHALKQMEQRASAFERRALAANQRAEITAMRQAEHVMRARNEERRVMTARSSSAESHPF